MPEMDIDLAIKILQKMPTVNKNLTRVELAAILMATKFIEENKPKLTTGAQEIRSIRDLEMALERAHTRNAILRTRNRQLEKEQHADQN